MQLEIDLLCGVIDALPCPAALLNRGGEAAYVSAKDCPVDLGDPGLASREEILRAVSTGEPSVSRVCLGDGEASAWGLLELYPVRMGGRIVGALLMFHPELEAVPSRADSLPTASGAIARVWERVGKLAPLSSVVLFQGEDGTGKSGFAAALHERSMQKGDPFVRISAGASVSELYDAASAPGTLFAHRVDRWPPELLKALSGVLGVYGSRSLAHDRCRIAASSGPDLSEQTLEAGFPEALYIRLRVFSVYIPPLRDRPEDILPAAEVMLRAEIARTSKHIIGFSESAGAVLRGLPLKGNLTELSETVSLAVSRCPGGLITADHLPALISASAGSLRQMRQAYTLEQIELLVGAYGDTVEGKRRAAKELGIGLSSLYRILAKAKNRPPASGGGT